MTRARAQRETSAGGVVYRLHEGAALFLLIRDSYQNWGFPKGHLESGERAEDAALREVREETGIDDLALRGQIETIDWYFRFRGQLIHKVCHFYLMETTQATTNPQRAEGITACRWVAFDEARSAISYANARKVLGRAHEMIVGTGAAEPDDPVGPASSPREMQLGLPLDLPLQGEST
jgi:8-oxo-dGTP pyrophosphatase MutT (NUDIX family)